MCRGVSRWTICLQWSAFIYQFSGVRIFVDEPFGLQHLFARLCHCIWLHVNAQLILLQFSLYLPGNAILFGSVWLDVPFCLPVRAPVDGWCVGAPDCWNVILRKLYLNPPDKISTNRKYNSKISLWQIFCFSFKCYLYVNQVWMYMYIFTFTTQSYASIKLIVDETQRMVVYKETWKHRYFSKHYFVMWYAITSDPCGIIITSHSAIYDWHHVLHIMAYPWRPIMERHVHATFQCIKTISWPLESRRTLQLYH